MDSPFHAEPQMCAELFADLAPDTSARSSDVASGPADDGCVFSDAVAAFAMGQLPLDRIRSVDDHLTACASCQSRMVELVRSSRPTNDGADDGYFSSVRTFAAGACVGGRYRIGRVLGRGGMGEVYEAFDDLLQTPLALKTLVATHCDSHYAHHRLIDEARIARRVCHPNVCRTYDAGLHDDPSGTNEGLAYVTMELLQGETLGRRLRLAGPLGRDDVAHIARDILRGLAALHRAGIAHRDVKADNIIVCAHDPVRRAAIVDLGLAVDLATQRRQRPSRARSSGAIPEGTVAYMAPEQLARDAISPATDVYGFGATLFEMLTGQTPFAHAAPGCRDYPSPRSSEALAAACCANPVLEDFFRRCLAPDPAQRFDDAAVALAAFDRTWSH